MSYHNTMAALNQVAEDITLIPDIPDATSSSEGAHLSLRTFVWCHYVHQQPSLLGISDFLKL